MLLKPQAVTEKPKAVVISSISVTTTLATLAMSTQVPPEIATANQDGNCLVQLERQAVSLIPEEEVERNLLQVEKKPSEQISSIPEVSTTSSFPQYSRDDLAMKQSGDPSIREFLKYWTANKKPNTRERCKLPKETFTQLKQWDRMQKEDELLWRVIHDQSLSEIKQLVLPHSLKEKVLRSFYDDLGHQGIERTLQHIRTHFYWPTIHADVEKGIKCCKHCTLAKMPQPHIRTPMGSLLAAQPLEVLAVDFTVLEPATDGCENMLVMTNAFNKFTHTVPTRDQKASITAKVLVREWFL